MCPNRQYVEVSSSAGGNGLDRKFYFCPPDHLKLEYSINPWMDTSNHFSRTVAKQQHRRLVRIFERLAPGHVELIPAEQGLPELCFFGDSVFAFKDKALFARFAMPERHPETDYAIEILKSFGIHGERVPPGIHFEGSGETMVWRDKILAGHGVRSSPAIIEFLEDYFDVEVIEFELRNPRFHHLDTALLPVSDDLLFVCQDAFSSRSMETLCGLDCEVRFFLEEELEPFALNSVALGNDIVIDSGALRMQAVLCELGFKVHPIDTSEFLKFGASVKCLTFQHYF